MSASCMLQIQYIESGGGGASTSAGRGKRVVEGGVGACPRRHSLDLTPLGLLPASQHFSSCPVKAAGEAILISRLNILITSDVISFICLDGGGGGGVFGRKCTRRPFLFFKMVDSGENGTRDSG